MRHLPENSGTALQPSDAKQETSNPSRLPADQTGENPRQFDKDALDIPDSFTLAGLTITVVTDNDLVKRQGMVAESRYNEQEVTIDKQHAKREFTEQAMLHEATHWILFVMNEDPLRNNEKFVDLFAHLLYQYLKTAGYRIYPTP